jgi:hypothetical protein
MVSQHTANVPSVHARLGSIPRLSAKLVSKKVRVSGGYGWPRLPVEQSAPLERPGSNPGTPTTRPRSPIGRANRLKIGEVWARIPVGPPTGRVWSYLRAPTTACYCERAESAAGEICDHSIPKRFKYLRKRSASFVVALRPRDALNNNRPASESVLHCRHTSMTWLTWTRSKASISAN